MAKQRRYTRRSARAPRSLSTPRYGRALYARLVNERHAIQLKKRGFKLSAGDVMVAATSGRPHRARQGDARGILRAALHTLQLGIGSLPVPGPAESRNNARRGNRCHSIHVIGCACHLIPRNRASLKPIAAS